MNIREVLEDEKHTRTITDEEFLDQLNQINKNQLYLCTIYNSYNDFRLKYTDPEIVSTEPFVDRLLRVCQRAKVTLPDNIQHRIVSDYTDKLFQLHGLNRNLLLHAILHSKNMPQLDVLKFLQNNNAFDNKLLNVLIKYTFKENVPFVLIDLFKTLLSQQFDIDDNNVILILGSLTRICWVKEIHGPLWEQAQHLEPTKIQILVTSPSLLADTSTAMYYPLIELLKCRPKIETKWKRYVKTLNVYYTNRPDQIHPDTQEWIENNNL